jgi:enamine deaminase RidA (YjgF/YER057c/UK114 family)
MDHFSHHLPGSKKPRSVNISELIEEFGDTYSQLIKLTVYLQSAIKISNDLSVASGETPAAKSMRTNAIERESQLPELNQKAIQLESTIDEQLSSSQKALFDSWKKLLKQTVATEFELTMAKNLANASSSEDEKLTHAETDEIKDVAQVKNDMLCKYTMLMSSIRSPSNGCS